MASSKRLSQVRRLVYLDRMRRMFACLMTAAALTGCSSDSSADLETLQGQTLELETTTSAAPTTTAAGSRDAEPAATTTTTTPGASATTTTAALQSSTTTTTTAALQASTTTTTTVRDGTGPTIGSPGISVDANAVRPGDPLTISAGGFSRSSNVRIELHSEPVLLAEVVADANGSIEIEVEIPAETPLGDHELVVVGVEPDSTRLEYRTGIVVDGDGPEMPEFSVSSTSVEPGDSLTLSVRAIDATGVSLVGFSMELNGAHDLRLLRDVAGIRRRNRRDLDLHLHDPRNRSRRHVHSHSLRPRHRRQLDEHHQLPNPSNLHRDRWHR